MTVWPPSFLSHAAAAQVLGAAVCLVGGMASVAGGQASRPGGTVGPTVGPFEAHADVGDPKVAGSAEYDAGGQRLTVGGAGTNMWVDHDQFHFAYRKVRGDFIVTARAGFVGTGVELHRKLGWQARATLDGGSPHATAVVHGDGLTSLQFRRSPAATTEEQRSPVKGPDVIQLERRGREFLVSVAHWGEPFAPPVVQAVDLPEELYVGVFVCSHNAGAAEQATFEDVRVTRPAPATLVPYHDYLGSRLEVLNVATGRRAVVYESAGNLEAPNWTPDGRALLCNTRGRLVRFDLPPSAVATGRVGDAKLEPVPVETGPATHLNNDHVLSFDGTMLGLSNNDAGGSRVYTVPAAGGTPRLVTPAGPSYLHGWSPDGRTLVYTARRRGEAFNIYATAADGTGAERQLTTGPGLDDGPEYAADGRSIFFCSTRTGRMQVWRMNPDGSDPRQVTDDGYNNWFPHVSPDGHSIVFVTFGPDVPAADHPYYKPVMIRSVPAGGGEPKVLAYVYGGQGTINVPSWSPDGRFVAFVSNTGTP